MRKRCEFVYKKCVKGAIVLASLSCISFFPLARSFVCSFSISYVVQRYLFNLYFFPSPSLSLIVVVFAFSWLFVNGIATGYTERFVWATMKDFRASVSFSYAVSECECVNVYSFFFFSDCVLFCRWKKTSTTKYGVCSCTMALSFFLDVCFFSSTCTYFNVDAHTKNRLLSWVKWAYRIWHQHFYIQTLPKVGSCT